MADLAILQNFQTLLANGYIPSVGAWVQVDPANNLTTVMNTFNTLGTQEIEIYLFDPLGNTVGTSQTMSLDTNQVLRLDLETIVPTQALPFEGNIWVWCRGATMEGSIGLQAIDLDFIDRSRPAGHVLASVHLIIDFLDTLAIAPYLDLVSPRLLVDETPEGAFKYQNYLGVAHVPVGGISGPSLDITVTNEAGEMQTANQTVQVPTLGSWFGDIAVLFPDLVDFLRRPGEKRGYGTINVREKSGARIGLAGMLKVVDLVRGSMLVGHLNDRAFARPAMKEN